MRLTLFFIIGATVFALGESTRCYDCLETNANVALPPGKQKCKKPFSSDDTNPKCNEGKFCVKGVIKNGGESGIIRGCVNPDDNPNIPNDFQEDQPIEINNGDLKLSAYFCKKDLCNSASLPTTTVSFFITFLITLFLV